MNEPKPQPQTTLEPVKGVTMRWLAPFAALVLAGFGAWMVWLSIHPKIPEARQTTLFNQGLGYIALGLAALGIIAQNNRTLEQQKSVEAGQATLQALMEHNNILTEKTHEKVAVVADETSGKRTLTEGDVVPARVRTVLPTEETPDA